MRMKEGNNYLATHQYESYTLVNVIYTSQWRIQGGGGGGGVPGGRNPPPLRAKHEIIIMPRVYEIIIVPHVSYYLLVNVNFPSNVPRPRFPTAAGGLHHRSTFHIEVM